MSNIDDVLNNPTLRLLTPGEIGMPRWCRESRQLVDWAAQHVITPASEDPTPTTIAIAKGHLSDRYWRLHLSADRTHRKSTDDANHPCLHRAYQEMWQALEDIALTAPVVDLLRTVVVEQPHEEPDRGPTVEEESGIVIGHQEDETEESNEDDEDA
jgi:hypothetical protein